MYKKLTIICANSHFNVVFLTEIITNQRDGSFGLLWTNPDVDVLSFESFFVSLHCWNGFGG